MAEEFITREEQLLGAIAGTYDGRIDSPVTNIEMYLAAIAQLYDGNLPTPTTNVERLLAYILDNGGGGGDITLITLTATENKVYTPDSGKAYKKVTVNVPIPDPPSGTITITENGTADVAAYESANVAVPQGLPIDVPTAAGMESVLVAANVGKAYRFTGETDADYTQGDIYVVEEA